MFSRPEIVFAYVCVGLSLLPSSAWAHKLNVFATADGPVIRGEAYYRGHAPVQNAPIRIQAADGRELGQTKTDAQGKFTFTATLRCNHEIILDAGQGHIETYTVSAAELPATLPATGDAATEKAAAPDRAAGPPQSPPPSDAAVDLASIRTRIGLLHSELQQIRDETRLRDVLGGIGYILGLMGLAFYFLGVRRQRRAGP